LKNLRGSILEMGYYSLKILANFAEHNPKELKVCED